MKRQRFLGIGDLIEDRQRIARRLLGGLCSGVALDSSTDQHPDRKHQAGKHGAADQQKEDLATIEPADCGQFLGIDLGIAAPSAVDLRCASFHFCFAVTVHGALSYPRCPGRGKFRCVRFTQAVGAVIFAAMAGKETSRS